MAIDMLSVELFMFADTDCGGDCQKTKDRDPVAVKVTFSVVAAYVTTDNDQKVSANEFHSEKLHLICILHAPGR